MLSFIAIISTWFWTQFRKPLTVAVDNGPFWKPWNQQEEICHVRGMFRARRVARRWVRNHPMGQARILEGHLRMLPEVPSRPART